MAEFFNLFRRTGFGETLEILNSFKKKQATQNLFFKALIKTSPIQTCSSELRMI